MPKYTIADAQAAKYQFEPQALADDGKWSPLPLCTEIDTDAGTATVLRQQMVPAAIQGKFRVVHLETGEVNPAPVAVAVEPAQAITAAVANVAAALEAPPVIEPVTPAPVEPETS